MSATINMPYGAFELKRCYQRHLLIGTGTTTVLVGMIFLALWVLNAFQGDMITVGPIGDRFPMDSTVVTIVPPPTIDPPKPPDVTGKGIGLGGGRSLGKHEGFAPIPVDDASDKYKDNVLVSPDDFSNIAEDSSAGNGGGGDASEYNGGYPEGDYIPPSSTFIPHQEEPVLVNEEEPKYPRLALEGGFAGYVIIEAFVGVDGRVRKAQVADCRPEGMGFAEEALAAAYKSIYRPAIQNGRPVGIWISYRIEFKIR